MMNCTVCSVGRSSTLCVQLFNTLVPGNLLRLSVRKTQFQPQTRKVIPDGLEKKHVTG